MARGVTIDMALSRTATGASFKSWLDLPKTLTATSQRSRMSYAQMSQLRTFQAHNLDKL